MTGPRPVGPLAPLQIIAPIDFSRLKRGFSSLILGNPSLFNTVTQDRCDRDMIGTRRFSSRRPGVAATNRSNIC
jgi:hypothetical protein